MATDSILKNVQAIFPKDIASELVNPLERIGQRVTDFIRGNPLVSTAAVGIGTTGLVAAAVTTIRKRRKKKKVSRRKSRMRTRVRRGKRSAASIRRMRLRNLAKARRAKRRGKRRIIRGPGLGRGEIKHSGRGTKGTKRVSFVTASGKRVSFKVKGTSKRRRGFRR